MATYWHDDGVLVLFPMDPETGRYRIIADIGLSDGGPLAELTLERVQQAVDDCGPGGLTVTDPICILTEMVAKATPTLVCRLQVEHFDRVIDLYRSLHRSIF